MIRSFFALLVIVLGCQTVDAADGFKSTNNPRFDAAVHKGVEYLSKISSIPEKEHTFVAYALFKAGEPVTSPHVASGIEAAVQRTLSAGYSGYDHIYLAGVDAMLLSDVNAEQYATNLQAIVDYVSRQQKPEGGWADTAASPVDTSMTQYALLAIWAAMRAGAKVSPEVIDRAAAWHMKSGNPDGGWSYRPGTRAGDGGGNSTHTMSMAGAGSLAICRTLLYGPVSAEVKVEEAPKKFGVLESAEDPAAKLAALSSFPNYKSSISAGALDDRIRRGFQWNETRFDPVCKALNALYFYYALERGAALAEVDKIAGRSLYDAYGEGLLTMQVADGSFKSAETPTSGTCFAILFFMRSTKGILEKQFGIGRQQGKRGNPFGDKEVKREPTELDLLIGDLEKMDFNSLDETPVEVADEIVRSVISIDDPEKLVGQADKLKSLMKHPNPDVRKAACWALGRTGDFDLIPMMLDGIRDPSIDVNVEAIAALRYISRKPNGFGETFDPLKGLPENAPPEERVRVANEWRQKAINSWSNWYFRIRPHEEQDGFDQLSIAVPLNQKSSVEEEKGKAGTDPPK